MSLFDDIKQRLDMKQVVEAYGFSVNRSGFCCCPFHAEKTASMKIYEKGYKCFGCGEGGDIIKFVQKYFDLSPIDACRKLNDDFSLGLETRSYRDPNKKAETVMLYQKRQELKEKENAALNLVSDYLNVLNGYRIDYQPQNHNEIPDKRFMQYLSDYENTLVLYEELSEASDLSFDEKYRFYSDKYLTDTLVDMNSKLSAAYNFKHTQEQKELTQQLQEGSIIGNTPYRDIPDKAYLKYPNPLAVKIRKELESSNVKFSSRVYSKLTTFTISKKDINYVRDIANNLSHEHAKLKKSPVQMQEPKEKEESLTQTQKPKQQSVRKAEDELER